MKYWYFFSAYTTTFSPLLVIGAFFLKYITVKRIWLEVINSESVQLNVKWFRIIRIEKDKIKEDQCSNLILTLSIVSFAASVANWIYFLTGHQGYIIDNCYDLLQFILLSAFYHYLHEEETTFRKKRIARIGVICVLIIGFLYAISIRSWQQEQTIILCLQSIMLIAYSIYSFLRLRGGPLVDDRQMSMLGEDMYNTIIKIVSAPVWFNLGVLVYFLVGLIIISIIAYIGPELYAQKPYIWIIHNVINISKDILFTIGMYYAGKYGMARRLKLVPAKYIPLEAN